MATIIVEGMGDIVTKPFGYGRALRKLKIDDDNIRVIFVDVREEWKKSNDPQVSAEREKYLAGLKEWNAEFIDKSPSNPEGVKEYQALLNKEVDAVFIATPDKFHISVARHWLTGNCKRIFIEKPLSNNLDEAKQWLSELKEADHKRLTAFDHYLAKVHAHFQYDKHVEMIWRRTGIPRILRFYILEDHSGSDKNYQKEVERKGRKDRNGPIENEGRIDTLQGGLILDLMPHVLALLTYFGDPRTIEVTRLIAAKYTGVDYDDNAQAGIKGETFAAIQFKFDARNRKGIMGEAYIGKGIRGSRKYPTLDGNVKMLEVEGYSRNREGIIEFDFNGSVANMIASDAPAIHPVFDLENDPYYYLVRDVAFKKIYKGTSLGIPIQTSVLILEKIITEMTSKVVSENLPLYKLGNKKGRPAPYLEDLLPKGSHEIPPIK